MADDEYDIKHYENNKDNNNSSSSNINIIYYIYDVKIDKIQQLNLVWQFSKNLSYVSKSYLMIGKKTQILNRLFL